KDSPLTPMQMAQELAAQKALSIKADYENSYILGADQLIEFSGEIIGKAGSSDKATEQLLRMSGRSHKLITSMCLITPQKTFEHTEMAMMHMRSLKKEQAHKYVLQNETWNCAGSYKIECQPALIFEKVITEDPTSILGLATFKLVTWLKELQYIQ
ncbi:MAG: Maf family protein, partial [Bdellovibrionales bacterium]|nr:Maf family protein [Bdellovibrionales bacterium]